MHITVVGTGYVGLVGGACFAETGNDVVCADLDQKKIDGLKQNILPIYEPGLDGLVERKSIEGDIRKLGPQVYKLLKSRKWRQESMGDDIDDLRRQ